MSVLNNGFERTWVNLIQVTDSNGATVFFINKKGRNQPNRNKRDSLGLVQLDLFLFSSERGILKSTLLVYFFLFYEKNVAPNNEGWENHNKPLVAKFSHQRKFLWRIVFPGHFSASQHLINDESHSLSHKFHYHSLIWMISMFYMKMQVSLATPINGTVWKIDIIVIRIKDGQDDSICAILVGSIPKAAHDWDLGHI